MTRVLQGLGVKVAAADERAATQAEYANKAAALELVDRNSRLGWEPSMDYMGGARGIFEGSGAINCS